MSSEAAMLITQVCSAVLAVAGVLALAARVFLSPRIREVDAALARIEAHLAAINGSVVRVSEWQRQHELDHARGERT
jgi:hypothetical protein